MEALKRTPSLEVSAETLVLSDGTIIKKRGISARDMVRAASSTKASDIEKGLNLVAAKILVNDRAVVYDDLLDCFSSDEIEQIVEFVSAGSTKNG